MPDLPLQIERFIVKQLACDEAPAAIAEEVASTFLRDVEAADVRAYCPEADGAALTPELRALYQSARLEYVGPDEADASDDTSRD
jgi:hypothetical protein